MPSYFAQAILAPTSGNSEDIQINGFACGQIADLTLGFAEDWRDLLATFYDDCKTAGALRGMAATGHLVKFYEIGAGPPNYPLFELPFTNLTAAAAIEMPMEVALCVSYQNVAATTVPRARRRGRIYISGWSEASNDAGRPTTAARTNLLAAFTDYVEAFNALGVFEAGIWSRTNGVVYDIEAAHVDNEWDTMRSRGGKATARSTWTLP